MQKIIETIGVTGLHVYTGLLLVAVGLAFVYWPLSFIVPGSVLVYMALRRTD